MRNKPKRGLRRGDLIRLSSAVSGRKRYGIVAMDQNSDIVDYWRLSTKEAVEMMLQMSIGTSVAMRYEVHKVRTKGSA